MEGHTESVMSLTMMSGHELVSAGMDNTIRVWDLNKMQEENVLQGVKANFCVDYSSKRKVWNHLIMKMKIHEILF